MYICCNTVIEDICCRASYISCEEDLNTVTLLRPELRHRFLNVVVNPRRACAARVTVVVVCVCRLVANSLLKGQFVLKTLSHTQRATKVKKFVGFSLKPLRCRDTALARCTATCAVGHFYSAENAHAHI